MLTRKHSAFLAQLLMAQADLGESTRDGSNDHAVFSMGPSDSHTGQVHPAKPSPNNMPISQLDVLTLQQVLSARAEGIEQRTRLDRLNRTRKITIWCKEDDEEMTLPEPETLLVQSLHYRQDGLQDLEDQTRAKTIGLIKKQEEGKSNLHAESIFLRNVRA